MGETTGPTEPRGRGSVGSGAGDDLPMRVGQRAAGAPHGGPRGQRRRGVIGYLIPLVLGAVLGRSVRPRPRWMDPAGNRSAARALNAGAATLSFSVVADSGLEHYRGGFHNPVMYLGPGVAALTLLTSAAEAARPRSAGFERTVFAAATATGLLGTGFHGYNTLRREGGLSWQNLFYGAPVAAPLGITFAGIFGLAARSLGRRQQARRPSLLRLSAGKLLATLSAMGLVGTAAEAGLLHFRGAFQDPFMYVPVTVPPLAAVALGAAASDPTQTRRSVARGLLWGTAAAGIAGMGFHAYGVHRNMGGWYNWSQMILQGPPLPAPPSFTGMALAGLAGLSLLEGDTRD